MRWVWAFVLLPGLAWASAPDTSPRPKPRPLAVAEAHDRSAAPRRSLRPKSRPGGRSATRAAVEKVVVEQTITEDIVVRETSANTRQPAKEQHRFQVPRAPARDAAHQTRVVERSPRVVAGSAQAVARSLRPKARPKRLRVALADTRTVRPGKAVRYSKKGSVCGIRGIRGRNVGAVRGKGGCGIARAVRVTEVDGVRLTREALIGCDAAKALYGWVQNKAKPIVGRKGGGLAKVQLIAGYSCRTRNSRKGAKLSEHAKGKAVDIAGFVLKDGSTMSVLRNWNSGPYARTLKRLHKSACGPFGTVLGPNANRYHRDHFHFDVARYRGGAYCK